MISPKNKTYILWGLFYFSAIIPLLSFVGVSSPYINIIQYCLPLTLLLWHSIWIFGLAKSALLLIPPFIIGLIFEIIGVNFGMLFGGSYFYHPENLGPLLFNVPILIPCFWSFFVYSGYLITSSYLVWLGVDKPSKSKRNIGLLLLLIIIDGLIVVAIDLFMDPIMVASNNWTWISGGSYFGIPLGNFLGWFIVTIISTGIFRVYEFNFPLKITTAPKSILLIPVVGYGLLALLFLVLALSFNLANVAIVGVLIMLPIVLINLFFYARAR